VTTTTTDTLPTLLDVRAAVLDALGMGAWEAEHLTGPQLVLRLVEAHRDVTGRLDAASHTAQRLACDVQELLSGEEWDRLRGHVASVEADNARLRAAVGVAAGLAAEAEVERLRGAVAVLGLIAGETVVADGDTTCTLRHWASRVLGADWPDPADLAARDGVRVTDDDGEAD